MDDLEEVCTKLLQKIKVRLYFFLGLFGCAISFLLVPRFQLAYLSLSGRVKSILDCLLFSPLVGLFFVSLFMLVYGGDLLYMEKRDKDSNAR